MATTKGTEGRPAICSCGWPIDGEFQHGTPCTPDCEAPADSFPARLVPAPDARPVVVGEVWEGVLEFRTVTVKYVMVGKFGHVGYQENGHAIGYPFEHLPLAEFRERFTRRGPR